MTDLTNAKKAWDEIDPPMKFRLVRADTMEPLGDWTTDLQGGMEYLEQRPDDLPKYVYINERGEVMPDMAVVWNAQGKPIRVPWSQAPQYKGNEPAYLAYGDVLDEVDFEQAALAAESGDEIIDDGSTEMSAAELVRLVLDRAAKK